MRLMCNSCSGHAPKEHGHAAHTAKTPCDKNWISVQNDAALREIEAYEWHIKNKPCPECQTKHLTKAEGFTLENAVMCDSEAEAIAYLKQARKLRDMRKRN